MRPERAHEVFTTNVLAGRGDTRAAQELPCRRNVKTTPICAHVLNRGGHGVRSLADLLATASMLGREVPPRITPTKGDEHQRPKRLTCGHIVNYGPLGEADDRPRRLAGFAELFGSRIVVRPRMQPDCRLMDQALRAAVVPYLRELGFTGSLPHFRRKRGGQHQLLSIIFNKYGGSFYVEAGIASEQRLVELQHRLADAGKEFSESKLDVGHCGWDQRVRLGGSTLDPNSDHWFVFGPDRLAGSAVRPASHYVAVATQALAAIQRELELFFGQSASPPAET